MYVTFVTSRAATGRKTENVILAREIAGVWYPTFCFFHGCGKRGEDFCFGGWDCVCDCEGIGGWMDGWMDGGGFGGVCMYGCSNCFFGMCIGVRDGSSYDVDARMAMITCIYHIVQYC